MTAAHPLAAEIRRAVDGDPWFGPAATTLLEDIGASTAAARFPGANHSIWEIVRHLTVWARYVDYRLRGGEPRDPSEGNWPSTPRTDEDAWRDALTELRSAHEQLVVTLETVSDVTLDAVTDSTPRDDQGEPVTLRRAVSGVAQHCAYHLGQVAVLKQIAAAQQGT